jgi:hypothetical protein
MYCTKIKGTFVEKRRKNGKRIRRRKVVESGG